MSVRNAVRLPDGRIDCEIQHPALVWIPFTANEADPEAFGRQLFAELNAMDIPALVVATPTAAEALDAERAGMRCSRYQIKAAMLRAGVMADVEAVVAGADQLVQLAWTDAVGFTRASPFAVTLAVAGLSETQIDDLFRVAMTITP